MSEEKKVEAKPEDKKTEETKASPFTAAAAGFAAGAGVTVEAPSTTSAAVKAADGDNGEMVKLTT